MTERKFELVHGVTDKSLLPVRATDGSAGYDFRAAKDMTIDPVWTPNLLKYFKGRDTVPFTKANINSYLRLTNMTIKPVLVPTGVCAKMPEGIVLLVFNRSSGPLKRFLLLANGVGVIDSDYYPGQIYAQLINYGVKPYTIHKGERIMQGLFVPYLLATGDQGVDTKRRGGLGSTGK